MNIRRAQQEDLPDLMQIYDYARNFMRESGNTNQWINGYPSSELIAKDIEQGQSFVCENEEGEIAGTFCFIQGTDPTYLKIYEGKWLNDEPYGVIHRIATNGSRKGIASACINWCASQYNNLRVDTHRDNIVMQNILKKHGFTQCGIIYVANGTERLAFHKVIDPSESEYKKQ